MSVLFHVTTPRDLKYWILHIGKKLSEVGSLKLNSSISLYCIPSNLSI